MTLPPRYRLRQAATDSDEAQLTRLACELQNEERLKYDLAMAIGTLGWGEQALAQILEKPGGPLVSVVFVIERCGAEGSAPLNELVAYIAAKEAEQDLLFPDTWRRIDVTDLFVTREHRRQGLARELLVAVEHWAANLPLSKNAVVPVGLPAGGQAVQELRINVLARNVPARELYEAFGFVATEVMYTKRRGHTHLEAPARSGTARMLVAQTVRNRRGVLPLAAVGLLALVAGFLAGRRSTTFWRR